MIGAPVVHPTLALRNLPNQLTGMAAVCKGADVADLDFYTVDFSVEGRPLVLATCKHSLRSPVTNQSAWLLEHINGDGSPQIAGWREILVDHDVTRLYNTVNSAQRIQPYLVAATFMLVKRCLFAPTNKVVSAMSVASCSTSYDSLGRAHGFVQSPNS